MTAAGKIPKGSARLILYVGKGGVGKTTLAASTAVRAADRGLRTLVVSTDLAHSLGDVFDAELGGEPRGITPNLFAQEVNVLDEVRRTWGKLQGHLADVLRQDGVSDIQADELAVVPGMEEIAALIQIEQKSRSGDFDCIVVDAAPTGETVRLLSMPESFQWYAGRIEQWRGRLLRFAGPLLGNMLPDLNIVDAMSQLADRVRHLRTTLTDSRLSSYRLVLTPDRTVLKEAQRAETYLNLFEYPIDAVVINRVLAPTSEGNPYFDALVARQQRTIAEIHDAFVLLPSFQALLTTDEPVGVTALRALAQQVFGEQDPTQVLHVGPTQRIDREGADYILRIPMPNVEVSKLDLTKRGDELYVDLGNYRREITLPLTLAALEPGTARVRGGMLEIPFHTGSEAAAASEHAASARSSKLR